MINKILTRPIFLPISLPFKKCYKAIMIKWDKKTHTHAQGGLL